MIKNKIIYLLIVIIIGFYAILYNDYSMWIISLTIIFLPILLFIVLFYTKSMIKVEFYSHVHVARKTEPIPILAKIKNPTIFPISNISLTIECSNKYSKKEYKKKLVLSIDGRTTLDISCKLTSDHVGNLKVSLAQMRAYDYLNVFSFKKKINKTRSRRAISSIIYYGLALPIFSLYFLLIRGIKIKGRKNLKKLDGAVIVSNHVHKLDSVMGGVLSFPRKPIFTSMQENFKHPVYGRLVNILGATNN